MKTLASLPAVALAFALSTTGLAAQQPAAEATPPATEVAARRQPVTQVRVTNHNWLDARLYLDNDGVMTPLGFVVSQQTAEFTISPSLLATNGHLRIVALPIGSRAAYVSPALLIVEGDALQVMLENSLALSTVSTRPAN